MYRRPSFVVLTLVLVSGITMYLASSTQIGFPYRPKTNSERVMYQVIIIGRLIDPITQLNNYFYST